MARSATTTGGRASATSRAPVNDDRGAVRDRARPSGASLRIWEGPCDRGRSGADAQLRERVLEVLANGARPDLEEPGSLLVGEASPDEPKDVHLARRESVAGVRVGGQECMFLEQQPWIPPRRDELDREVPFGALDDERIRRQ